MKLSLPILLLSICLQFKAQITPSIAWTYSLNSAVFGSAASADIDKDGKSEIVFAAYNNDGRVHCLNAEDGSLKWTYNISGCGDVAISIYDLDGDDTLDVFVNGSCNPSAFCINGLTGALTWSVPSGGGDSPPTIADIDNDGKPEIVFGNFSGQIRILNGEDGSLNKNIQVISSTIQTDPVLVDVNNDGNLDIIVANHFNNTGYYTYCYDYVTSTTHWVNFHADNMSTYYAYHGGALADIDKDGKMEYVIGANNGLVRALNVENGSVLWSISNPSASVMGAISIADVNNDDTLDVIYHRGDANNSIVVANGFTGQVKWSYPVMAGAFRGSAVSDLNGNGKLDLVSAHYMGKIHAVEPFSGLLWTLDLWPLFPQTLPYLMTDNGPLVDDFDGDGFLDVFVAAGYSTYSVNPNSIGRAYMIKGNTGTCPPWTMYRHDHNRSGYISANEVNTQCSIINGVKEKELIGMNVKVSPQPFIDKTEISVSGLNTKKATLSIRDLQGRLVAVKTAEQLQQKGSDFFWEWNSEKVEQGIYLYQIEDGSIQLNGKLFKNK